ncbi:MAG: PQ-loop domain-containing transporter [Coriobacteriia bacterium]|nr:PQ-loop domain-containing transporter [Coriobacteriia bacterium]
MDALQITGGVILCAGYIPQIRRILVSRSAHDLSLSMWISVLIGLILMEAYAVYLFATSGGPAVLITNSVSLTFAVGMVALILIYGSRPALTLAVTEETIPETPVLSPVEGTQAA